MTKLCIRYDLSIDTECKDGDYLYVVEVNESKDRIQVEDKSYLKMRVVYGSQR